MNEDDDEHERENEKNDEFGCGHEQEQGHQLGCRQEHVQQQEHGSGNEDRREHPHRKAPRSTSEREERGAEIETEREHNKIPTGSCGGQLLQLAYPQLQNTYKSILQPTSSSIAQITGETTAPIFQDSNVSGSNPNPTQSIVPENCGPAVPSHHSQAKIQKQQNWQRESSSQQQQQREQYLQENNCSEPNMLQQQQRQDQLPAIQSIHLRSNQSHQNSHCPAVAHTQCHVARTALQRLPDDRPPDKPKSSEPYCSGGMRKQRQCSGKSPTHSLTTPYEQSVPHTLHKDPTLQPSSLIPTSSCLVFTPNPPRHPTPTPPLVDSATRPHSGVPVTPHNQSRRPLSSNQNQQQQQKLAKSTFNKMQVETNPSPRIPSAPSGTAPEARVSASPLPLPQPQSLIASVSTRPLTQVITNNPLPTSVLPASGPFTLLDSKDMALPSGVAMSTCKAPPALPLRTLPTNCGPNGVAVRPTGEVLSPTQPESVRDGDRTLPASTEIVRDPNQPSSPSTPAQTVTVSASNRTQPELVCIICDGMKFNSELELRRHEYNDHKDERTVSRTAEGRYLCFMHSCTQSFGRRHVMERHFRTVHLMFRDFPCQNCDKAFADSSTREAHRTAVHEKKKPWICRECSSSFTQSSSLGKHRRRFHAQAETQNATQ